MRKIIFIVGGTRSGKSRFAVNLAKRTKKVTFIATAEVKDSEMRKKILEHKKARPKEWNLIEEPLDLFNALKKIRDETRIIIIDCISLWTSNFLMMYKDEKEIIKKVENLIEILKKMNKKVIIVSNEVGVGIVPETPLARRYRDILGRCNQIITKEANEVYFMIAGIPLRIKRKV